MHLPLKKNFKYRSISFVLKYSIISQLVCIIQCLHKRKSNTSKSQIFKGESLSDVNN